MYFTAFPDGHWEVIDILVEGVADGDRAAWRERFTGTQQGEFMGMPPTGRKVAVDGIGAGGRSATASLPPLERLQQPEHDAATRRRFPRRGPSAGSRAGAGTTRQPSPALRCAPGLPPACARRGRRARPNPPPFSARPSERRRLACAAPGCLPCSRLSRAPAFPSERAPNVRAFLVHNTALERVRASRRADFAQTARWNAMERGGGPRWSHDSRDRPAPQSSASAAPGRPAALSGCPAGRPARRHACQRRTTPMRGAHEQPARAHLGRYHLAYRRGGAGRPTSSWRPAPDVPRTPGTRCLTGRRNLPVSSAMTARAWGRAIRRPGRARPGMPVRDLRDLLAAAAIGPRYALVGHSGGVDCARLCARVPGRRGRHGPGRRGAS